MADPTPYSRTFSFTGFQTATPQDPLPAPQVDNELDEIAGSVATLVAAVQDVRRSDGALKNGVVTADSLASGIQSGLIQLAADSGNAVAAQVHADQIAAAASAAAAAAAATSFDITTVVPDQLAAAPLVTRGGVTAPYVAELLERDALTGLLSVHNWIPQAQRSAIWNGTSTYDATAAIQAAVNSGEDIDLGVGAFRITDAITMPWNRAKFMGRGDSRTGFKIGSDFNLAAAGMIVLNENAQFGGFYFDCFQPAAAARASLIHYPPCIKTPSDCQNIKMFDILAMRAWTAFDLTGNTTGDIDRLRCSAFNKGLIIDGTMNFLHVGGFEAWPYGLTDNAHLVSYYDGNAVCLDIGFCQDFHFDRIMPFCQVAQMRSGTGAGGVTGGAAGVIDALVLDTNWAKMRFIAGQVSVGSVFSSKLGGSNTLVTGGAAWPGSSATAIQVEGADVSIGNIQGFANGPTGAPGISVTAGNLNIASGRFVQFDVASPALTVSGGTCSLGPALTFAPGTAAATRTAPMVIQSGTGALRMEAEVQALGGTGEVASLNTDVVGNYFDAARYAGRAFTLPATLTAGTYRPFVQAGQTAITSDQVVTFGTAFKRSVSSVTANVLGNPGYAVAIDVDTLTLSTFTARSRGANAGTNTAPSVTISWTAVGF